MGVGKERGETGWVVRLEGEMGVADAPALKECLLEALASGEGVVVDMSGVESLEVCCLQVVLAASRGAQAAAGRLSFGPMSKACREAVALAGEEPEQWPAG